jgi:hypothetical protein
MSSHEQHDQCGRTPRPNGMSSAAFSKNSAVGFDKEFNSYGSLTRKHEPRNAIVRKLMETIQTIAKL